MFKHLSIVSAVLIAISPCAFASDHADDVARTERAARVFREIMDAPNGGISHGLLQSAKCIAIVPGEVKFAFIFGANYGRGVAVCRTARGWSAPSFVAIEGGSFGFQAGGSSTDLVLLFMNQYALESLLRDKVKLGADASIAAGPVGRSASAATDVALNAEILSYSRSKGVFAGVSLAGAGFMADKSGDTSMYGHEVDRKEILHGEVAVPASARRLEHELREYADKA
jgi:lipid-binding SYLF domain-containing protein